MKNYVLENECLESRIEINFLNENQLKIRSFKNTILLTGYFQQNQMEKLLEEKKKLIQKKKLLFSLTPITLAESISQIKGIEIINMEMERIVERNYSINEATSISSLYPFLVEALKINSKKYDIYSSKLRVVGMENFFFYSKEDSFVSCKKEKGKDWEITDTNMKEKNEIFPYFSLFCKKFSQEATEKLFFETESNLKEKRKEKIPKKQKEKEENYKLLY
ncbi:hypothetical protein IX329_001010 [Fusobacterium necrophorum]|nr:hypothetical protein [Fusobacterium necrophorum]MBR8733436.1 hypothetical protein [Fusobacterium necrophorum]MBR8789613.1 hypothetical protein [Fusobacterium necrophorum]